ncbi:hypothetical protein [Clostridium culturomicium]|uniref:hypothetical protein n=1 Tax=Clostridium culturomicium TaxID=1499683 RepID=UPI0038576198
MTLLKKDLHKSIEKGLSKLDNTLVKIAETIAKTEEEIAAKEAELKQLEEQLKNNLLEGEVLYAAKDKQEIERVQAELIRTNRTLVDYQDMQQEAARESLRKLFPTLVEYRDEINTEIKEQTTQFIEGVKELQRVHLADLNDKREQFNDVKSKWVSISNDLGITQYDVTERGEEKDEKLKVFSLTYTNLDDGRLTGLLNGLNRYMA